MWHVIWHVVAGLGLIVIGGSVAFLFIIFSAFAFDSRSANSAVGPMWAIAALGAAAAVYGVWLILFL